MSKLVIKSAAVEFVSLGEALDYLLDRSCRLGDPSTSEQKRGLVFPTVESRTTEANPGIGNVLIVGRPGFGKSTLATQMLVALARKGCDSAYVSLEEDAFRTEFKASQFGWKQFLHRPKVFKPPRIPGSETSVLKAVLDIARPKLPDKSGNEGRILVSSLLPRPVLPDSKRLEEFYWEQYEQLEWLVRAASGTTPPLLRAVVIDSINMLSPQLDREALHRVFDLFRCSGILGIFTAEAESSLDFDSTMADVVISLKADMDSAYRVTYLSIEKSRFTARAGGLHPYKINSGRKGPAAAESTGLQVFPSVHSVIAATRRYATQRKDRREGPPPFSFGWEPKLTEHLMTSSLRRGDMVMIEGPYGTYKSPIALNFLFDGLNQGENTLYLRLRDPDWTARNLTRAQRYEQFKDLEIEEAKPKDRLKVELQAEFERDTKARVEVLRKKKDHSNAVLIVADFHPGMLLPEEFVDMVRGIYRVHSDHSGKPIQRVALDDVSTIGLRYPLLRQSNTTGALFLSTFVHLMRNFDVDLMLVGTRSRLEEANQIVDQACALATGILRTEISTIYGSRYVLLSGDGIKAHYRTGDKLPIEAVPAVLQRYERSLPDGRKQKLFRFDWEFLRGFNGFESKNIHRPGICFFVYQENTTLHQPYFESLRNTLGRLRAQSVPEADAARGLEIVPFTASVSDTLHALTEIQADPRPMSQTVISMVDEFAATKDDKTFCKNVLFVAWQAGPDATTESFPSWQSLEKRVTTGDIPAGMKAFWYDQIAPETLSCAFLDAVFSGVKKKDLANATEPGSERLLSLPKLLDSQLATHADALIERVCSLANLLAICESRLIEQGTIGQSVENNRPPDGLPHDAIFFLCWYSQLRELIHRRPDLAHKLRVAALPGKGFQGDWKIRTLPGSVSYALGDDLAKSLCTPQEDYRRFQSGVGLPAQPVFASAEEAGALPAWPGAIASDLAAVLAVHGHARRRSEIEGYPRFMRALSAVCRQTAQTSPDRRQAVVAEKLRQLPAMIRALTKLP